MHATFRAGGTPGKHVSYVRVNTNDPENELLLLGMQCEYSPAILIVPQLVSLGVIGENGMGTAHGEVFVRAVPGSPSFRLLDVDDSRAPGFEIGVTETNARREYRITLDKNIPFVEGRYHGILTIHTDSHTGGVLSCSIVAEVPGKISVQPDTISLARDDATATLHECYLRVLPGLVDRFEVLGVDVPDGTSFSITRKGKYVMVKLAGIAATCSENGKSVRLLTDVPGMETVAIPIIVHGCDQ